MTQTSVSQAIRSILNGDSSRRVPLNLRAHLAAIGVESTERIIVDGLPPGASLTSGQCKAGRGWTILPHEMDDVDFVAAEADGQTHTLSVYVLTPDPIDEDLAKTKAQIQISITAPTAPPQAIAPASGSGDAQNDLPDNVIRLTGEAGGSAPRSPELPPEIEASDEIRSAVEQYIAAAQAEWQAETAKQVSTAEDRIRVQHQDQLAVIEGLLATEEQMRTAALEAKWQAEIERQVAAAEARLTARHKEQSAALEARWRAKQAVRPGRDGAPSIDIDALLDEERRRWRSEQTEFMSAARAEWEAAAERRLADARAEWQIEEARRVALVRESWQAELASLRNAAEAEWKAELERQVAAVEARWLAKSQQGAPQAATAEAGAQIEVRLRAEHQERLAALEAAWQAKADERVATEKAAWAAAEAERRTRSEAEIQAATQQQIAAIEPRLTALYEMRLTAAEQAWRRGDDERLAAIEATWRKAEAERMGAAEARWRAEHERRIEIVLQNAVNMVKGQFGAMTGHLLSGSNATTPASPPRTEPEDERKAAASEPAATEKGTVTHLRAVVAA